MNKTDLLQSLIIVKGEHYYQATARFSNPKYDFMITNPDINALHRTIAFEVLWRKK